MDENVLKIALSGLMHDIGKLANDSALFVSQQFLDNNADLYQPFKQGHYTHQHAVFTAAFIDHIEKLLPRELNQAHWGLEDPFINLAAGHHNPQTPLQWLIAIADRVSSGWDRVEFEEKYNLVVTPRDYRRTRLVPVFEHLMPEEKGTKESSVAYDYCYPLKEISPQNIFPEIKGRIYPENNEIAASEYKTLFDEFVFALERLFHREESLTLWFEHFESLMMIFSSLVPSARAGSVIPDISLYDHSKTTSALASALYLFHKETGNMTIEAIRDYDLQKFLIISGDFYGIQNFIFSDSGEAGKNRSKILRGRSFAVSLFSELAADMLCREIGLPSTCVILNVAGKFYLLAPNTETVKESVNTVEKRVNDWLMKISYGESAIGISFMEASAQDFVKGKFVELWDKLAGVMEKKKFRKIDLEHFGGSITGYLDEFRNDLRRPLCPFCGKRPSSPEVEGKEIIGADESACEVCRDHIFLGANLVKKNRLAITTADADIREADNKLIQPIFGYYQAAFVDGGMKELARSGKLLKYWDISLDQEGHVAKEVTAKFLNGYIPMYREEDLYDDRILAGKKSDAKKEELIKEIREKVPKTLEHIANKALNFREKNEGFCGIEALGVLKADVDQLGFLMSCGLKSELFTISRLVTLSRQMNWYFSLYLPHLLKTNPHYVDIYTVFAGGDDLFLIGPWNRIIDLAGFLSGTFADYVCHNREIHFSAGISLHKAHTPLEKLAEGAEAALDKAKNAGRNRVTLFSETASWDEFRELEKIKNTLQKWQEKNLINNAMIYRLADFIRMAEMEKRLLNRKDLYLDEMECCKWHALFCYAAERNVGKGLNGRDKEAMVEEFSQAAFWLKEYGGRMKIALWDLIYNQRKGV